RTWAASRTKGSSPEFAESELAAPNPTNPNQGRSPARSGELIALMNKRYTYIRSNKTEELYDEVSDPHEQNNLARDDSIKPVLERCRNEVTRILQLKSH